MKKTTKNLINAITLTVGGTVWAWNYTQFQSIRRDALDEIDALEKSATKKDKAKAYGKYFGVCALEGISYGTSVALLSNAIRESVTGIKEITRK